MKLWSLKFILYSPVILRGTLWVAAAMLGAFIAESKDLKKEVVAAWFWVDYCKFWGAILLAGILSWRTYLDSSLSQHKEKMKEGKE